MKDNYESKRENFDYVKREPENEVKPVITLRRESVASNDEPRTETQIISDQENRQLYDPRKDIKVSF